MWEMHPSLIDGEIAFDGMKGTQTLMDKQAGKQTDLLPFLVDRILVVSLGAIHLSCVATCPTHCQLYADLPFVRLLCWHGRPWDKPPAQLRSTLPRRLVIHRLSVCLSVSDCLDGATAYSRGWGRADVARTCVPKISNVSSTPRPPPHPSHVFSKYRIVVIILQIAAKRLFASRTNTY